MFATLGTLSWVERQHRNITKEEKKLKSNKNVAFEQVLDHMFKKCLALINEILTSALSFKLQIVLGIHEWIPIYAFKGREGNQSVLGLDGWVLTL